MMERIEFKAFGIHDSYFMAVKNLHDDKQKLAFLYC